jgi:uncharacterized protein
MTQSEGLQEFQSQNYDRAFELLLPLAEAGDAESQAILGNLYQFGCGIDQDLAQAALWYERAALQGYGVAANNLAEMLTEEPEKAAYWRSKAIEQGFLHTRAVTPVAPWH